MLDSTTCYARTRLASSTIVEEQLVDAQVVGQLGMERREQQATVAHEHRLAVELAEHLDVRAERRGSAARG